MTTDETGRGGVSTEIERHAVPVVSFHYISFPNWPKQERERLGSDNNKQTNKKRRKRLSEKHPLFICKEEEEEEVGGERSLFLGYLIPLWQGWKKVKERRESGWKRRIVENDETGSFACFGGESFGGGERER